MNLKSLSALAPNPTLLEVENAENEIWTLFERSHINSVNDLENTVHIQTRPALLRTRSTYAILRKLLSDPAPASLCRQVQSALSPARQVQVA